MAGALLSSCSGVTINDHVFCGSLGVSGAACAHLLTNETYNMDLQQFAAWWNDLKHPKVATDLDTILDLKADIEILCNNTGACSAETEAQVSSLLGKINTMHKTSASLVPRSEHGP